MSSTSSDTGQASALSQSSQGSGNDAVAGASRLPAAATPYRGEDAAGTPASASTTQQLADVSPGKVLVPSSAEFAIGSAPAVAVPSQSAELLDGGLPAGAIAAAAAAVSWSEILPTATDARKGSGHNDATGDAGVWPLDEHNAALLDSVRPRGWQNPVRPKDFVYDLVTLGAGAGGLAAAKEAAKRGKHSALVERHLAGGSRLLSGCVPSKALLRCARAAAERRRRDLGSVLPPGGDGATGADSEASRSGDNVDFAKVMERMRRMRATIASESCSFTSVAKEAGADVFQGQAVFKGAHELEVAGQVIRFRKAVIATGGRACVPDIPGIKSIDCLTSATLFNLTALPPRLIVLGGGTTGLETAQAFSHFGSSVTVVEASAGLLGDEDAEAASALQKALALDGIQILTGAVCKRVESSPVNQSWPNITLQVAVAGQGASSGAIIEEITCDALFIACGRVPNVTGLGLEAAGIKYDPQQGVGVDDELRTSNQDVLAIGTACSRPELQHTHAATAAASMVVQSSLFGAGLPAVAPSARLNDLVIPHVVHTNPEVAFCGLTPASAKRKGIATDTYISRLDSNDCCILDGAR